MKRRSALSPVLVELLVTIVFFALSAAVVVQLLAAANRTSSQSTDTANAAAALSTLMDELRADPEGSEGMAADGSRRVERVLSDGTVLSAQINRSLTGGGALYSIYAEAEKDGETLLRFEGARYIAGKDGGA